MLHISGNGNSEVTVMLELIARTSLGQQLVNSFACDHHKFHSMLDVYNTLLVLK